MIGRLRELYDQLNQTRSGRLKVGAVWLVVLKIINSGVGFISVPLFLAALSQEEYGLWLTITSVVTWIAMLDLGLGNGLRNKLAEALAKNDEVLSRQLVSTTYIILGAIVVALLVLAWIVLPWLNWQKVFNAHQFPPSELMVLVLVTVSAFLIQMWAQLIKMILLAYQMPGPSNLINTIMNVVSLGIVATGAWWFDAGLVELGTALAATQAIVPLLATGWWFRRRFRHLLPSRLFFRTQQVRSLLSLGGKFFIMNAAAIVVFITDNMLITHTVGLQEVPSYNIAYKYYSVVLTVFTLFLTPFWSAFTEAWIKKDRAWIARQVNRVNTFWLFSSGALVVMWLISTWVYTWWTPGISVSFWLNAIMCAWVIVSSFASIYGYFMAGTGIIQLSVWHAVLVMIINIPLSLFFAVNCGMGSAGVILATLVGAIPRAIFLPIQYNRLMRGTAKGIWAK